MKTALLVLCAALTLSCRGTINGTPGPGGSGECPPAPGTNSETERIRLGLAATCAGCHSTGDTGYFASSSSFESLLVRNARLVKPGHPDESDLIKLLQGTRTGSSLKQMPISGDAFALLDAAGKTTIHVEEISAWITSLEVPGVATQADLALSAAHRMDAMHLEFGLRELIGLTELDFYGDASNHGIYTLLERSADNYDLRSPDRAPGQWAPRGRFTSLGGASAATSSHGDLSISTSFVQTLTPLAQAWCGMAVRKAGNTALFKVGTPLTKSTDRAAVRAQIADWYMLFLAEAPTESDIDDVQNLVFAPLEAKSGPQVGWVGTCSYFVRHPLFVFY